MTTPETEFLRQASAGRDEARRRLAFAQRALAQAAEEMSRAEALYDQAVQAVADSAEVA